MMRKFKCKSNRGIEGRDQLHYLRVKAGPDAVEELGVIGVGGGQRPLEHALDAMPVEPPHVHDLAALLLLCTASSGAAAAAGATTARVRHDDGEVAPLRGGDALDGRPELVGRLGLAVVLPIVDIHRHVGLDGAARHRLLCLRRDLIWKCSTKSLRLRLYVGIGCRKELIKDENKRHTVLVDRQYI